MNWIKNCEICNTGLCKTVDERKEKGQSERAACRDMSGESEGLYSEDAILHRYRYHTGKVNRSACEIHTESESLKVAEAFEAAVKKHKIPPSEQGGLAKKIKKGEIIKRGVQDYVEQHAKITGRIPKSEHKVKDAPNILEYIRELEKKMGDVESSLFKLVGKTEFIENATTRRLFHGELAALIATATKVIKEIENGKGPEQRGRRHNARTNRATNGRLDL